MTQEHRQVPLSCPFLLGAVDAEGSEEPSKLIVHSPATGHVDAYQEANKTSYVAPVSGAITLGCAGGELRQYGKDGIKLPDDVLCFPCGRVLQRKR